MKLVVGLGNPGRQYEHTRHNAGFEVLEELVRRHRVSFRRSWRWPLATAEIGEGPGRCLLVKPLAFMNRSGPPVAALMKKKGAGVEDAVVIVDDVDLPPGQLRIRKKGSAGGHNGLKSLIDSLGSEDFARVRVGVGRPEPGGDMVAFVLGRFAPAEREAMKEAIARAADAVEMVAADGLDKAMNKFNG